MKINFISFLDPFTYNGGGEQISKAVILEGRRRGHLINEIYVMPHTPNKPIKIIKSDFNILWDIYNCPEWNIPFRKEFLDHFIYSKTPYIYGTGGYEDLCALGTVPCCPRGPSNYINLDGLCLVDKDHPTFGPGGVGRVKPKNCSVRSRSPLIEKASLAIFFSDLHLRNIETLLEGKLNNAMIAIPPITGLDKFFDMGLKRDIKYLSYGGHLEYKGFFNIKEMFPNEKIIFIGDGPNTLPSMYNYGTCLGRIPQKDMLSLFNRVENFIHLPRWPEPFGITTLQAKLCGCNVIENENSVAGSITDLNEIVRWETCSPIWDRIEDIIC